jgi:predicted alpha/beta-fold hydrolase
MLRVKNHHFVGLSLAVLLSLTHKAQAFEVVGAIEIKPKQSSGKDLIDVTAEKTKSSKGPQIQSLLSIVPDGGSLKPISPDCEPRRLEEKIFREAKSPQEVFKLYNSYFYNCAQELSDNSAKGLIGLANFSLHKYEFFKHPNVKRVLIELDDGTVIPSILAMKDDDRPRPFIVVQCGVFCSAEESASTKNYLMSLFDESPFNIVILSNRTGFDFISTNHIFSMGGHAEGLVGLKVGKWLREKSELRDRISSLHYMGISLGGNAAIMQSIYNEIEIQALGQRVFNSIASICPVLDLEATLRELVSSPVVGDIMYFYTRDEILKAQPYLKDIPDLITKSTFPGKSDLADKLGEWASESLTRRGLATAKEDFWKQNSFFNYNRNTSTPLLVWASKDDIIVHNKPNTGRLAIELNAKLHPNLGLINLPYGSHCGFSSVYGDAITATVLRSFVLFNSPEYKEKYLRKKKAIALKTPKIGFSEQHLQQVWKFKANKDKAKLTYKVFSPSKDFSQCSSASALKGSPECTTEYSYDIPITSLTDIGAYIPESDVQAEALTREFNSRVELWTSKLPINGSRNPASHIVWRDR